MKTNNCKLESFPLIDNKCNECNEWSDEELDDLFESPLEQVLDSMTFQTHSPHVQQNYCYRSVIYLSIISFVFGLSFAFLFITYFQINSNNIQISSQYSSFNSNKKQLKLNTYFDYKTITPSSDTNNNNIRKKLFQQISSQTIAHKLKSLTKKPQLAGTEADEEMAKFVFNEWKLMGIEVSLVNYSVLLSYQNISQPNLIRRIDKSGHILYNSSEFENPLNASADEIRYYRENPPFLAYSASTEEPLKGNLVYVNFGRVEDYDYLKQINVSVNGSIAFVRYGKIFRANIVKFAEENGAIGLIIYSDPLDFTDGNIDNTYPHSVYLPKSGVQRGTTKLSDGDPMTPFYPSIESAYRLPIDKVELPRIPAHAISYGDAKYILEGLKGPKAPKSWIGKLNITYNIGPGYENDDYVSLEVYTRLEPSIIYNVIGVIHGCVEPDRYVLVGNHRDSWTFGSVDPSSGTAAMLELTKAFTNVIKNEKWCPRRSIVFCSWGAEEYGLIGSTEWVEQNQKLLQTQAIAYLNVDIAVEGNYSLQAKGVPLLYQTLYEAAKHVPNPDPKELSFGRSTVYDTWISRSPNNISNSIVVPKIKNIGSGSDFSPFLQITGVPVIDISFTCDDRTGIKCYPLYHTMYETYNLEANLLDNGFLYNKALTQIWTEMVRSLSDSVILPFSVEYYPIILKSSVIDLKKSEYNSMLLKENITLEYLETSVQNFENAMNGFVKQMKGIDYKNPLEIRRVNDVLMFLERTFIEEQGLPLRKDYKHILLSPSSLDSYSGSLFSGLYDLLYQYKRDNNLETLEDIKKHVSVIVFHINCAKQLLKQSLN